MEKVVLHAVHRDITGKQVRQLRRDGKLPGVIYGHHIKPTALSLDLREATRILNTLSGSSLITVDIDGKEEAALVREKQKDFIKGTLLHVDFQVVSLTEKLNTGVEIELTGIAPAVKDFNGVVVSGLDEIEVECLPQYLPERIIVDISKLMKVGDAIYVRDLPAIENVTIMNQPDELIAIISATKEEAVVEVAPVAEGVVVEEPEVIEKGKKEEEVPEEGAKPEKGSKPEK
jgi:large subunit ribosomal protein L25